jgi:hypothetical protein
VRRWLAALAVVTVGFLASPAAVPIYDGVGQPDDPYLLVGHNPGPKPASTTVGVSGGQSGAVQVRSVENGPQFLLDLSAAAFRSNDQSVTLTGTPLAPDGTPPSGTFDGNSYRVTVSRDADLDRGTVQGFLFLRAAVMTKPTPVIVHRTLPTDPWAKVATQLTGRDILSTPFRALGDYAVVQLPGAKPLSAGGVSVLRIVLLGGGVALLLIITVLVLRSSRSEEE